MFNGRYTFDSMSVAKDSYVFASEYAVFDWGIPTIPRGNIQVRQHAHAMREHLLVDALCDADDVWLLLMLLAKGARYNAWQQRCKTPDALRRGRSQRRHS